jgi:hypothetical protein
MIRLSLQKYKSRKIIELRTIPWGCGWKTCVFQCWSFCAPKCQGLIKWLINNLWAIKDVGKIHGAWIKTMKNSTENDGKNAPNQNVGDSYPILSKTHAINQNK